MLFNESVGQPSPASIVAYGGSSNSSSHKYFVRGVSPQTRCDPSFGWGTRNDFLIAQRIAVGWKKTSLGDWVMRSVCESIGCLLTILPPAAVGETPPTKVRGEQEIVETGPLLARLTSPTN
jgi:hypothetical protein